MITDYVCIYRFKWWMTRRCDSLNVSFLPLIFFATTVDISLNIIYVCMVILIPLWNCAICYKEVIEKNRRKINFKFISCINMQTSRLFYIKIVLNHFFLISRSCMSANDLNWKFMSSSYNSWALCNNQQKIESIPLIKTHTFGVGFTQIFTLSLLHDQQIEKV